MKRFIPALLIVVVAFSVLIACDDNPQGGSKSKDTKVKQTFTVPTFSDAELKLIPDPCTTVTIENINFLVPGATETGSLQQNSIGPNKTCEWKIDDVNYPRLGVSIIKSANFFKPGDERVIDRPDIGNKVSIAPEYTSVLGGDSCGNTIYVVSGNYSLSVAYCDADGKATTDEKLIELVSMVKNALPAA